MKFLWHLLFVAISLAYCYGNAFTSGDKFCPPSEQISPCTCFKAPITQRVTADCSNFTEAEDLKEVFTNNQNWNLQDVNINKCIMAYIPATMLEQATFQSLNVSSSTLITLFDVTPIKTPELNLYLYNLKLMRGFEWSSIANSSLLEFGAWNTNIKNFGQDFKDNIPRDVQRLWFENTKTSRITKQAFAGLSKLAILTISHGSLKTISRNMFPRPWIVNFLDFSYNKISSLPEDMFVDMPQIGVFNFEGNLLKSLPENAFVKSTVLYNFKGNPINCNCDIKWITKPGKIIPSLLKGECEEPSSLKERELGQLKQSDFEFCV